MNLMDLFIKIGVKDEATSPLKKITGAIGKGVAGAAKVGIAAVGAAGTALGALVTQSVKAYASYEQLVGGVETLFSNLDGTVSAAPKVLENAARAYETAGLSANQYMETVTSFSAALVSSLGGDYDEAARIADQTIIDMADNANKMGTSMDAIQSAYAGFAKQNYTMLDNLKLGYGGTKSEMERLLADASEFSGIDYNIENLEDVYEAIHVIQQEMGIAGATAREADDTIEGSFNSLKAAWQNLITGLGNGDADLGVLFEKVVSRAKIAFKNLMPVVRQALKSVGQLIGELAPIIEEELPGLVEEVLPGLISAATSLVGALAKALPEILSVIWDTVDGAISNSKFGETWNHIKEKVSEAVQGIKERWDELKERAQPLIDKVTEIWQKFKDWATESDLLGLAIEGIGTFIEGVILFAGDLAVAFDAALEAGKKVADGLKEAWNGFVGVLDTVLEKLGLISQYEATADFSGHSGSFASGNDYIPYDNYPARLHRGEAVLTAREADAWRRGEGRGTVVNNFSFNGVSQSDLDYIVAYVNRGLVAG